MPVKPESGERKGKFDPERPISDQLLRRQEGLRGVYPPGDVVLSPEQLISLEPVQALYASKIVSYAQGFMLLRQAAKEFGWNLNYGGIALMWRGGCIIRSR